MSITLRERERGFCMWRKSNEQRDGWTGTRGRGRESEWEANADEVRKSEDGVSE